MSHDVVHIGTAIRNELLRQERSITWLSKKLFCDRSNVYDIFKRQSIDSLLLLRISIILEYNFFTLYEKEFLKGDCHM
ncbi:MAG: XRE family transcriptional regulator [Bacteroidaceae bacterium]|nr:XRE family transcriptional regulator [Bacteroidaceae bacterium]